MVIKYCQHVWLSAINSNSKSCWHFPDCYCQRRSKLCAFIPEIPEDPKLWMPLDDNPSRLQPIFYMEKLRVPGCLECLPIKLVGDIFLVTLCIYTRDTRRPEVVNVTRRQPESPAACILQGKARVPGCLGCLPTKSRGGLFFCRPASRWVKAVSRTLIYSGSFCHEIASSLVSPPSHEGAQDV
mgnify:CR=1 FL=1